MITQYFINHTIESIKEQGYILVKGAIAYADNFLVPLNDFSEHMARQVGHIAFQKQGIKLDEDASLAFFERGKRIEVRVLRAK